MLSFQPGDVVYGLCKARDRVNTLVNSLYYFSKKDIIIQNTLTDAVWDRKNRAVFNKDEKIAERLNDVQRGIFLENFYLNIKNTILPKINIQTYPMRSAG